MIPTINVKCKSDHEWNIAISPWWFSIKDIKCPKCNKQAVIAMWSGMNYNNTEDYGGKMDVFKFDFDNDGKFTQIKVGEA